MTSYTRWVDAVQVRDAGNQEVYLTFSPRFERIWLESKQRLLEYVAEKPADIGLRSQYALRPDLIGDEIVRIRSNRENRDLKLKRFS